MNSLLTVFVAYVLAWLWFNRHRAPWAFRVHAVILDGLWLRASTSRGQYFSPAWGSQFWYNPEGFPASPWEVECLSAAETRRKFESR